MGVNCDFVATGNTPEEVMRNGMEHGTQAHGMKPEDMTDEKRRMAMAAMKQG